MNAGRHPKFLKKDKERESIAAAMSEGEDAL